MFLVQNCVKTNLATPVQWWLIWILMTFFLFFCLKIKKAPKNSGFSSKARNPVNRNLWPGTRPVADPWARPSKRSQTDHQRSQDYHRVPENHCRHHRRYFRKVHKHYLDKIIFIHIDWFLASINDSAASFLWSFKLLSSSKHFKLKPDVADFAFRL